LFLNLVILTLINTQVLYTINILSRVNDTLELTNCIANNTSCRHMQTMLSIKQADVCGNFIANRLSCRSMKTSWVSKYTIFHKKRKKLNLNCKLFARDQSFLITTFYVTNKKSSKWTILQKSFWSGVW
jgi:hypothetical protein